MSQMPSSSSDYLQRAVDTPRCMVKGPPCFRKSVGQSRDNEVARHGTQTGSDLSGLPHRGNGSARQGRLATVALPGMRLSPP